ncbi:ribonuclease H2 non-catalytic subunit-domain-containing protein [Podospora didyma]|uniref:Ribonuclease H2 non-catalytic subunit-domain-containing protein n=1 Tax=Podospora didyma TaxID=330526 RepID=A0AAE0P0E8_9PEZI|nr:ribonuclease H2 non-catalytic subunit-domain-containing protein [Podospora didyma]
MKTMSSQQPVLRLNSDSSAEKMPKATPHLLPCRVHHTGSIEPVQSFWDPKKGEDGSNTTYFRGRRLVGQTVALPEGYRGVIAVATEKKEETATEQTEVVDLEADKNATEHESLQVQAEFDEMVIWNHEATVDSSADPYARGMEEWVALADQIHSHSTPNKK